MSKVLLIVAGLSSSFLLPLALDQTAVGQFFLAQLFIAIASTVLQCGLTFTIPATITSAVALGRLGDARRLTLWISLASISLAIASTLIFFFLLMYFHALDGKPWVFIATIALATIPFTSQIAILTELLKSIHSYKAANNLSSIAGCSTALFLMFSVILKNDASLGQVLIAGLTGPLLCSVAGFIILFAAVRHWPHEAENKYSILSIFRRSLPNLSSSIILFGLAQFDILLVSLWLPPADVALYGIAVRFCALLLLPLAVANAAIAPIAVELLTAGKIEELQSTFSKIAVTCAILATIGYLLFAFVGLQLIQLWNPSYNYSYFIVLVLGVGQIIHASGGVAGAFLMTAGDYVQAMRLTIFSGLITVAACLIGFHLAGMIGLAVGSSLGNIVQIFCFVRRARIRFGIETSIIPWFRPQPPSALQ